MEPQIRGSIWLRYNHHGGRIELDSEDLALLLSIRGFRAKELGALVNYACHQADWKTLTLDMDGYAAQTVSGYMGYFDHNCVLSDLLKIIDGDRLHGRLAKVAYSAGLSLPPLHEALLSSTVQELAAQGPVLSTAAPIDTLSGTTGFSSPVIDHLKGELEALSSLNVIG